VLRKVLFVALALILLLLPLAVRWFYFYDGTYEPGEVPRPDLAAIEAPAPEVEPFVDHFEALPAGTILVDRAHSNRFEMAELSVLQARLAARGQRLQSVEADEDLANLLRFAQALIIISPGEDWTIDEIELLQDFVDKGGRLLLVTDPTRFEVLFDEFGYYLGMDSDVPHINDLAARFGLVFQDDYLYNTAENEGNFRNIKLTDLSDHDLTQGLEQVVFYASHSIISEEPALISAGGETRSSISERSGDLAVAVLGTGAQVLALGDLTFMMEPHNAVYSNDVFIANLADYLSGAQRDHDLANFPLFFDDQADLVYTGDPLLDSDLLLAGSTLQGVFDDAGKELSVREVEDEIIDTLFLGLYEGADDVESYLASAGVTLLITPTQTIEEEVETADAPAPEVSPVETSTITSTATLTPTVRAMPSEGVTATGEITVTPGIPPAAKNRVEITGLGEMVLTSTSLLLLQSPGDRQVLVVLADTEAGLEDATTRLVEGDLGACVFHDPESEFPSVVALCPTGEAEPGDGSGGWKEPDLESEPLNGGEPVTDTLEPPEQPEEPEEPKGQILVVAVDNGEGRYDSMTSADDYVAILSEHYDVSVRSMSSDGPPQESDLEGLDLVIWTAGDFDEILADDESGMIFLAVLQGIPVIVSGAYVGDTGAESVQRDIQVSDPTHPLVDGFDPEEVIRFVPGPSGGDYATSILEDSEEEGTSIPLVRGPDSEDAGMASVVVVKDEFTNIRIVLMGFPLYLLPEKAKSQLVLNAVEWMLAP
jgi:hypothetical protein